MGDEIASRNESVTAVDAGSAGSFAAGPVVVGDVLAGRYDVRRVLGRGGMGVVVVARDRTLGAEVAIKLLRPEFAGDRRWAERLAREVKLARQLHHPNVCRVFDFVQADGRVFIVMELAVGTLRAELAAGTLAGRSIEQRLGDVGAVVAGLAAIHEAEIVHRDVTTQNVLRLDDGRLVVSDFGLATDADETTASIQGGTVAYMAPELGVGGRASFSSDVWALGIVIHEIMFGRRPTWRAEDARRGIDGLGRGLIPLEKTVFEICRACTAAAPSDRPRNAAAVAGLLKRVEAQGPRRFARVVGKALVGTIALAAAIWAGSKVYHRRTSGLGGSSPTVADMPVEVTGTPRDWTDSSRVLTTVDGRIQCLVALPDQRTLRFVWGLPRKAQDVDIDTGESRPSPLVPAAFAEGCPDLSPTGHGLIFQGHDQSGRPVILRSSHADGSDAHPIAASIEPDQGSDPKWMGNGKAVAVSLDVNHLGIVDSATGRVVVGPDYGDVGSNGLWGWFVGGDHIVSTTVEPTGVFRIRMRRWPSLRLEGQITLGISPLHDGLIQGEDFIVSGGDEHGLIAVNCANHRASHLGMVREQGITFLAGTEGGIGFVSRTYAVDAWVRSGSRVMEPLTHDGETEIVADCGPRGYLMLKRNISRNTSARIVRVERTGGVTVLASGKWYASVTCSRRSNAWWLVRGGAGAAMEIQKCNDDSCRTIRGGIATGVRLSPDETRVIFWYPSARGYQIAWIPSDGGEVHEVSDTETNCNAGWSSDRALWVSRKIAGTFLWTEVDADTGKETGRTMPGGTDCSNGDPDSLSPVARDLTTVTRFTSQVRFKTLGPGRLLPP